jgi:hypothetical protein
MCGRARIVEGKVGSGFLPTLSYDLDMRVLNGQG